MKMNMGLLEETIVKSGSTPPTRRFELFDEYFKTVIKREKQRELLPGLFDGNDAWIEDVHGEIAYLLQRESESEQNAAAELSVSRCCTLIRHYIHEEGFVGDLDVKTGELFWAITVRLPFLAKTTDEEGENCVLFPIRSLQEYCAAKHILSMDDTEDRYNVLQDISLSAYWRNVFLFVAGEFSVRNKQSMIDNIYMIVKRNNGDLNLSCQEQTAFQLAIPGSRLALDILCDNLFERRRGQDRYVDIASKLLDWDYYYIDSLLDRFLRLPEALLRRIIIEYAIPRLFEDKNPNEVTFALLWVTAQNGNKEAWNCLEDVAETLQIPNNNTLDGLINELGVEGLGPKILKQCISWLPYCQFFIEMKTISSIINSCMETNDESLMIDITRWVIYHKLLSIKGFFDSLGKVNVPEFVDLSDLLNKYISNRKPVKMTNTLLLPTCFVPNEETYWTGLKEILANYNFIEIFSLIEFKIEPSAKNLRNLIASRDQLPIRNREFFYLLLEAQDWVLEEVAKALRKNTNTTMLIQCFDEKFIKRCQEKEVIILQALQDQDYNLLSDINAWDSLISPIINMSAKTFPMFFNDLIGKPLRCQAIEFGYRQLDYSPTVRANILSQFALCFNDGVGEIVALSVFAHTPIQILVKTKISFPYRIHELNRFRLPGESSYEILKRIEVFSQIGGSYLESYALVPFIFSSVSISDLRYYAALSAKYYSDVRETKNDCALLGVILLLLGGEAILPEIDEMVREDLYRLLPQIKIESQWRMFFRRFSLWGALLVQKVGIDVFKGTAKENDFVRISRYEILQKIEALPAEKDKSSTLLA